MLMALMSIASHSKELITILYAFPPSESMAGYSRVLAQEANSIQDRYTFVFDTKPGAGNSIAANHALNNKNVILSTTTAFFVRPNFYPNESYRQSDFHSLLSLCETPMGVGSSKYRSWKEVPTDRPVFVGISGLGVTSHVIASQLLVKYPNMVLVPFRGTGEALMAQLSGQVDFSVAFVKELDQWAEQNKIQTTVLGITGSKEVAGYKPLINYGFPSVLGQINNSAHLAVPASLPQERAQEIQDILVKAARSPELKKLYEIDYCSAHPEISHTKQNDWFEKQIKLWQRLSQGISISK